MARDGQCGAKTGGGNDTEGSGGAQRGGAGREPVKAEPRVGRSVGGRGLRLGRGRGLAGTATEEEILNWVGGGIGGCTPLGEICGPSV